KKTTGLTEVANRTFSVALSKALEVLSGWVLEGRSLARQSTWPDRGTTPKKKRVYGDHASISHRRSKPGADICSRIRTVPLRRRASMGTVVLSHFLLTSSPGGVPYATAPIRVTSCGAGSVMFAIKV